MNPMSRRSLPRWLIPAFAVIGLLALATFAAREVRARQHRRQALEQAQQAMSQGRLAVARKGLTDLAARWPRDGEVLLLLGRCDEALGRPERALEAWARIAPRDPHFGPAAESR